MYVLHYLRTEEALMDGLLMEIQAVSRQTLPNKAASTLYLTPTSLRIWYQILHISTSNISPSSHTFSEIPSPQMYVAILHLLAVDTDISMVGQGKPPISRRPQKAGRTLRVHPLRMLLNILPVLLVEQRRIPRPSHSPPIISLAQ
jgi:hypothetical protein